MPITNAALDRFVAQGFSMLTNCAMVDLSPLLEGARVRINDFVYNSALRLTPTPRFHTVFFTIIRRALAACTEYEAIRAALILHAERTERENYAPYFEALYRTELCVSATAQAYQFIMKIPVLQGAPKKLYQTDDGSAIQRLVGLYNAAVKHIQTGNLTPDQVHAIWLTNDGVSCSEASITWAELASMVEDVGHAAGVVVRAVQGEDLTNLRESSSEGK